MGLAHLALQVREDEPIVPEAPFRATPLAPSAALRPYVRQFLVVESLTDRTNTLLPDTAIIAGFRFQGACSQDGATALRSVVTGLRDTPRRLSHAAGSGTILAMFTATGAAAFVREPLDELFNASLPLELALQRSQLTIVEEQLAEAHEHTDRARALERFLLGQLRERRPDPLVVMALACIRESRGRVRIEELAQRAGVSQSTLERRFRERVGASPKKYAAIARVRHAVRLRQAGAKLTEIAYAAGYSDQSHFIRDFRRLSGQTPEAFFQSSASFC